MEQAFSLHLTNLITFFIILSISVGLVYSQDAVIDDEQRLLVDLFKNTTYSPAIRPVIKISDNVTVEYIMKIINIYNVNEDKRTVDIYVWMKKVWKDLRLTWDPSKYNGLTRLEVPSQNIWTPSIVQYNGPVPPASGYSFQPNARVTSDGTVTWVPADRNTLLCDLDPTYYPSDSLTCLGLYGSWTMSGGQMNIVTGQSCLDKDDESTPLITNQMDFSLVSSSCSKVTYNGQNEEYHIITVKLKLKRFTSRIFFHVVVGPGLLLGFLTPFVFLLPNTKSHKFIVAGFILFCQMMIMNQLARMIPRNPTPPVVSMYYMALFTLTLLTLLGCIIATHLTVRASTKKHPPPWWLRSVFFTVGKFLREDVDVQFRMSKSDSSSPDDEVKSQTITGIDVMADWRTMAVCLDRFMFVSLLVLYGILSLVMLPLVFKG